jgi:hypothetical protein
MVSVVPGVAIAIHNVSDSRILFQRIRSNIASKSTSDKFWYGMKLLMMQFDGLCKGYQAASGKPLRLDTNSQNLTTAEALYLLNSIGDLETLNDVLGDADANANAKRQAPTTSVKDLPDGLLDCSALIRMQPKSSLRSKKPDKQSMAGGYASLADVADIAAGHTTWRSYYAMLRVYKVYELCGLQFPPADTASRKTIARDSASPPQHDNDNTYPADAGATENARRQDACLTISMPSSPGLLHSKDDFYALSNGLVVIETTNGIYNHSLYTEHISPKTALTWQRVQVANMMTGGGGGSEWVRLFAMHNSGTVSDI